MAFPIVVKTYNTGTVDSIGNVLFMAGVHRQAAIISRFMFHGVGFDIQSARMELKDIKERLSNIENDQTLIAGILAKHTTLTKSEIRKLFTEAAFLPAAKAKESGIVDEVGDFNLPKGIPILPLIFNG